MTSPPKSLFGKRVGSEPERKTFQTGSQAGSKTLRGRILDITTDHLTLRNMTGVHSLAMPSVKTPVAFALGDWVEVSDDGLRLLTPNRRPDRSIQAMDHVLAPRRLRGVATRQKVEGAIRGFFLGQDFLETRTPLLVPCPGMETDIRPFEVRPWALDTPQTPRRYLPTSPEFAMKRLLVGGLERIFQIAPAFRDEPPSTTHLAEFTLLEWYRAHAGYEDIMRDTEALFEHIARDLFGRPELTFQGRAISVRAPWPRLRVRDLFTSEAHVDLAACSSREALARECKRLGLATAEADTWNDLYFRIWLNIIEPRLPNDRAVFVTRYPASQSALAVIDTDPDGTRWAKRFELYAGGIELGNAFEELTDPAEQRARFIRDMEARTRAYGETFPPCDLDERFLEALEEGLPPSGGIAIGVDRMVMLFGDEPDIQFTHWL